MTKGLKEGFMQPWSKSWAVICIFVGYVKVHCASIVYICYMARNSGFMWWFGNCLPTMFPAIPYVYVFAGVMFHDQLPREMMHIYLYRFVKIQDLHASNALYSVYSVYSFIQFIHVRTYIMCCIQQVGLCVYCTRYRV